MSIVIPNNYGNATFVWRSITQAREFTVTMGFQDVLATGDANAAAAAYRVNLVLAGAPCEANKMTVQWEFMGTRTLLRNNAGILVAGANNIASTGTAASAPNESPMFTTLIVSKQTAFAGRQYRGRMYPPLTLIAENSVLAGGELLPSIVAPRQAEWSFFLTQMNSTNYPPQLLHDSTNPLHPFPTPITSLFVRPVVGLQRRRRTRGA